MLCAVITGPYYTDIVDQLAHINPAVEHLEFRIDLFKECSLEHLSTLLQLTKLPVIFTLRSKNQGGLYTGSDKEKENHLYALAALNPCYLDLEYTVAPDFFKKIRADFPLLTLICSYHNFEQTPHNLTHIYNQLLVFSPDIIKIATYAVSSIDALRMLCFVKFLTRATCKIIGFCMGELGQISRILSPIVGNYPTFASITQPLPNTSQLSVADLLTIYHYNTLGQQTKILSLIGGSVDQSLSHHTHNAFIQKLKINAVFVKIQIHPHELDEFFNYAHQLTFLGAAVTIPLKEEAVKHTAELSSDVIKIDALNTLIFNSGSIKGYNTDIYGAHAALSKKLKNFNINVIIIGAGGVAKAIAYDLVNSGSDVLILNRNEKRAQATAKKLGCRFGNLNQLSNPAEKYDVLINCTPVGSGGDFSCPIDPKYIIFEKIVMDVISFPQETSFLKEAKKRNCTLVYGKEMFMYQAIQQFILWFDLTLSIEELTKLFNGDATSCLQSKNRR